MKRNKRKANLGRPLTNPAMVRRAKKLRLGNLVRLPDNTYIGDWVRSQVEGEIGVVVDIHPYGWDGVVRVRFSGTKRRGGLFAFWKEELELVKR